MVSLFQVGFHIFHCSVSFLTLLNFSFVDNLVYFFSIETSRSIRMTFEISFYYFKSFIFILVPLRISQCSSISFLISKLILKFFYLCTLCLFTISNHSCYFIFESIYILLNSDICFYLVLSFRYFSVLLGFVQIGLLSFLVKRYLSLPK